MKILKSDFKLRCYETNFLHKVVLMSAAVYAIISFDKGLTDKVMSIIASNEAPKVKIINSEPHNV